MGATLSCCYPGAGAAQVEAREPRVTIPTYATEIFGAVIPLEAEICEMIAVNRKVHKSSAMSQNSSPAGMARRSSLQNGAEAGLLAKALPEPPAPDIARSIAGACEKNRLFAMISTKMREDMAKNFRAVDLAGGDTLTTEGQDGCTFFVLESGRCSIEVEGTLVGALAPWQSAGELEIINKQPRRATIKATETSRVWCLGQEHVTEIKSQQSADLRTFLTTKVKMCSGVKKAAIASMACVGAIFRGEKNEHVMTAGESALVVGIVISGEIISTPSGGGKKPERYREGMHFGYADLESGDARRDIFLVSTPTATVFMLDKRLYQQVKGTCRVEKLTALASTCFEPLQNVPELEWVKSEHLEKLALRCTETELDPGATLSDKSNLDYVGIVTGGKLHLTTNGVTTTLVEGDSFNAEALKNVIESESKTEPTPWDKTVAKADDELGCKVAALPISEATKTLKEADAAGGEPMGSVLDSTMCSRSLNDLEDIGLLGNGAYGSVRMVMDKGTKVIYALKSYNREKIMKMQVQKHVENEKLMMLACCHPFVLRLIGTFEDTANWHMVLELVQGGDLFGRLDRVEKLDNHSARFYMAGTLLALDHLHERNIVYRDLKPENLLIDHRGYIKLADFGLAKKIPPDGKTFTVCGTPEYMSPELIGRKGHNKAVDYWSIGILIFEMLSGMPPFYDDNPMITYTKIFAGKITWPKTINSTAKDLIKRMLVEDVDKRIGNLKGGVNDVKRHAWMQGFDFQECLRFDMKAPWVPSIKNQRDLSFFDP